MIIPLDGKAVESCQARQCGGLLLQRLRRQRLRGLRRWLRHCLLLRGNAPHVRLRKVAQGKAVESCQALECGGLLLQRLRRRGPWGLRWWLRHCLLLRGNAPHVHLRKAAHACHLGHGGSISAVVGVVVAIAFDIWVTGGRPCGWQGRTGGFIRTYKTLCDRGTWENGGGAGTGTSEGGATEGGRTYRGTACGLGTSLSSGTWVCRGSGTIMSWETKRQLVGMRHKGREDRITCSIS